jgi:murein L,D-transpeptidase YcbB/YkuD
MAALYVSAFDRAGLVAVALERERWMNFPLGARHVRVNIADFHARLVENNRVTFETRTVVGKNRSTHRTPEFSDVMEFMVINPTWHVPHSIATREYLPKMQQDPNAAGQLDLYDRTGRRVARAAVNFASYTARSFPYRLKQPPGDRNALGLVKFMFPNPHNVYLHDTPTRGLFARGRRDFSSGCVRVKDPLDLAAWIVAETESWTPERIAQVARDLSQGPVMSKISRERSQRHAFVP